MLVVCTGQAGGRAAISLERVAINVNDARIADNAGAQPVDTPVVAGGPAAYFTTLPIKAMLQALLRRRHRCRGVADRRHLRLQPRLLRPDARAGRSRAAHGVRGGLVHVPWLPEQGQPSMRVDEIVRGLRGGDRVRAAHRATDIRKEAGRARTEPLADHARTGPPRSSARW